MKVDKKVWVSLGLLTIGTVSYEAGRLNRSPSLSTPVFASSTLPVVPPGVVNSGEPSDLNIFVSLSKKAVPSVVNISTLTTVKAGYQQGNPEDLFRQFFGGGLGMPPSGPHLPPRKMPKAAALGSGFVIDSSGIILTNNHVVAGADEIKIQFTENPDEKPTDGKVIGRDPELDVALIKVKTTHNLVPLSLGDSEALQVGEYVMAIGNPYGNGHSVSHGIVSAKGRLAPGVPLASYLQTDAPINPGNSGGPLLNLKGEVVGINNAIDARAQGISFAIPINYVKKILVQLETRGKVERGYIGAVVGPLSPEIAEKVGAPKDLRAPFITQINPGTSAERAGLQPYDVITEVDGTAVHSPNELVSAITSVPVGKSVPLKIIRNGKSKTVSIQTAVRPGESVASADSSGPSSGSDPLSSTTGMMVQNLAAGQGNSKGVIVKGVEPGSPAESAGIRPGDIILEIDRKEVTDVKSLAQMIKGDKSYLLRVKRPDSEGPVQYSVVVLDLKKDKNEG